MEEQKYELFDNIDIYLKGKYPGTRQNYGYFHKRFTTILHDEFGYENAKKDNKF